MDRNEGEKQRPPPSPPPRGQPWAGDGEHSREHRDPTRVVEKLRKQRVAPISFHCRATIKPIRIANGSAKMARPYTRYTRFDWVGVNTPTISEMDFSSATHSLRVIS